jgi:hypothetical protein
MPAGSARRRVRLARELRHLPRTEAAWIEGEIEAAHVSVLGGARTPVTEELLARDEKLLLDAARTMRFDHFARVVAYWSQHADPDGTEVDADLARAGRRLRLSQTLGGMYFGEFALDPLGGAAVANGLGRIEAELFEADWAEARARLGEAATPSDLARTSTQRRADALVEMAIRSQTAPADGRRPAPVFTVLVGYETLAGRICELANGAAVSPGSLLPWLTEAFLERVVFDTPARVIEVGERRRLFEGALRRAIEVRDRACFHPSCTSTAEHCQVDHVIPWSEDGPTRQDNGRLACAFHNRNRHRRP